MWADDLVAAVAAQVPAGKDGEDGAPGAPGLAAGIWVDGMPGDSDDARLANAMAYARADPARPPLLLSARTYRLAPIVAYDGFRLIGAQVASNAERSAVGAACTRVVCTGTGTWLTAASDAKAGQSWDVTISGISFTGNSGLTWLAGGSTVLWCWRISDVSFQGFRSVLGTQAGKLLLTACLFDGWWDIANSYQGAVHIGGSDCVLWPSGGLVDSNTAYLSPGGSTGQFHCWLDGLSKSTAGPLYVTAEGGWGGVRITGGTTGGPVHLTGLRVEGRNAGAPGNIACLKIDGGWTQATGLWAAYCLAPPVQVTGGLLVLSGAHGAPATTPPPSWLQQSGGTIDARQIWGPAASKLAAKRSGGVMVGDGSLITT